MNIKFTILLIIVGGVVFGRDISTDEISKQLDSPDNAQRHAAFVSLTEELKKTLRPRLSPDDVQENFSVDVIFGLLKRGLQDSSVDVRTEALRDLSIIALNKSMLARANEASLTGIKPSLEKLSTGPDGQMRAGAVHIYSSLYEMSPQIEQQWIASFGKEQSNDVKRELLFGLVRNNSSSPRAQEFVINQINDPRYAYNAAMAILANIKPPPERALSLMIAQFAHSPDPGKRDLLARAIQLYGKAASPYLELIKQLRDQETNPVVKNNLNVAIDRVSRSGAQITLPPAPQNSSLQTSTTKESSTPRPSMPPLSTIKAKQSSARFPIVLGVILVAIIAGATVFFLRRKQP